eukprot:COSAG02_NODE_15601_length_1157_cov_1.004726_1_plen_216_part_00
MVSSPARDAVTAACQAAAAAASVLVCLSWQFRARVRPPPPDGAASSRASGLSPHPSTGFREAAFDDKVPIKKYTIAMAAETESCALDPDKVEQGVGFVLAGEGLASKYWVATDDSDQVIGMVGISPEWSDWWGVEYWWVIAVYVEPSSRRKGGAAKMLRGVLAAAEARGVQAVNLRVEKDNARAQALYRSVGFAVDPSHLVMTCGRTPAGEFVGG